MPIYEGKVNIHNNSVKGITLTKGDETATLDSKDAADILNKMISSADRLKVGIDRWSLFIPELTVNMSKNDKQLPVAKVKAMMDGTRTPVLIAKRGVNPKTGRAFVSPQILLASPVTSVVEDVTKPTSKLF